MQSGLEALSPRHALREIREQRKADFDYCCAYCGIRPHPRFLTIDHVIPRSQIHPDFADMPKNLVPCCEKCNSSKGSKDAKNWYRKQSFYSAVRWSAIAN